MDSKEKETYIDSIANARAFLFDCLEALEPGAEAMVDADEKYTKEFSKITHEISEAVAKWRTTKLRRNKRHSEIMHEINMKRVDAAIADLDSWARMFIAFEVGTQEDE